jgi:hypothetical protein
LMPVLAGAISEGAILAMLDDSVTAQSLSIDFNCWQKSKANEVQVDVPIRGMDPIEIKFAKDCRYSPAKTMAHLTIKEEAEAQALSLELAHIGVESHDTQPTHI